jgi:hypothetical protein
VGAAGDGATSAGGDGAMAGAGPDGAAGAGACCVDETISWGRAGGFVIYHDTSTLEPCAQYTRTRTETGGGTPSSCAQTLQQACGAGLGADDVVEALADPDVQAALATAPVLYGLDTRPLDGQVFQIQVEAALIEVGNACQSAQCTPIPDGVGALRDLLVAIDEQELAEPCSTDFP